MSKDIIDIGADFDLRQQQDHIDPIMDTASNNPDRIEASPTQTPVTAPKIHIKPRIPLEEVPENMRGKSLTVEDIDQLAAILKSKFDPNANIQVMDKSRAPITDFSKLTEEDIDNPEIFIEAKPFMAGDPLKVTLKDNNYVPRWVKKNSQRLGYMMTIGFTYVTDADLGRTLEVESAKDANGHYSIDDVVLMKIPKSIYYPARKAQSLRAQNVVNASHASTAGMVKAQDYMYKAIDDNGNSVGGEFSEAQRSGQLKFYQPQQ